MEGGLLSAVPLQSFLDPLVDHYDREDFLSSDPLSMVYELAGEDARNQEIIGFLSSGLAYGRVSMTKRNVRDLVVRMDGDPISFVEGYSVEVGKKAFDGWTHRLNCAHDMVSLCAGFQRIYGEFGSLNAFFLKGYREDAPHIGPALNHFGENFLALPGVDSSPARKGLPGVSWLFARPSKGSACKRLNLFLRWMIRSSFPDLGIWKGVASKHLIMPVDTHVARICRYLGLSRRQAADWKMALEITERLKDMSPEDPVRYDWAISRLGILSHCPSRKDPVVCEDCSLVSVCQAGM